MLNPAQQQAVDTLSGPLLVLAGAGTGKTRVVTHRIANLIRHGTPPSKILAVTFTRKAANEMAQRAGQLLGKRLQEKPEISTIHALCMNILRRQIHHLGYPKQFAIYDRGDQESLARAALREIQVPNTAMRPGDLLSVISRWKSASLRPPQAAGVASNDLEHLAAIAYRRYQDALRAAGAVDFDDLLLCTEELFTNFPKVLEEEAARYRHLLVDEYQDTNGSQYRILKGLAEGHRNFCVVGDDDQSIYGWRGAQVQHILRFNRDWPDARVVRLEDNYRSTGAILQFANQLIAFNRERHPKVLRAASGDGERPRILACADDAAEAQLPGLEIHQAVTEGTAKYRDFALLFRTNEQTQPFESEFRKLRVPYVVIGGTSFFERKEVRDLLAYLKLLCRPHDEPALRRIINTPPRGIGDQTAKTLSAISVAEHRPLWTVYEEAAAGKHGLNQQAHDAVSDFVRLIEHFRMRAQRGSLSALLSDLIEMIKYEQEVDRTSKTPEERQARWNSVQQVVNALADYEESSKKPSLADFLDEVALDPKDMPGDKNKKLQRDAVVLMTLHSAKGLEFPYVYMVAMEEGTLPHRRSLADFERDVDEERRLCYVGITRAQKRLTLTFAKQRRKRGKMVPTEPSRFLYEMLGQADNGRQMAAARKAAQAGANGRPAQGPAGKKRKTITRRPGQP
jgi:DNA helicase-2/ATP-dependent DNA helicase PcrA